MDTKTAREHLLKGQVLPAMPLALNKDGSWSEKYQRALARYYVDSGAGGLAVGVHSTQFEIRDPEHALFEPVLRLCSEELDNWNKEQSPFLKIAGICGDTKQAIAEAGTANNCGYHAGLLSMTAMKDATLDEKIAHCREVAKVIPVIGFYLQPTIGGCVYPYEFWRKFAEIKNVIAIKMAPFDRYATLDVIRAVADAGRDDIALYTGNDDNIINDLLTPFEVNGKQLQIVGGLLGQWAMWTERAVQMLANI
ncbi:MAG: dihydrodipicolinate synthase family protein, partial [Methylococcales bacterium]|nr:dihydrodipicolinate synthase family protein [Methylococcales bacterium]